MNFRRLFKPFRNKREIEVARLLTRKLHISFRKIDFYLTALRHKSAARNIYNEPDSSNERLEFLGDAILDSVVAEYLFFKYPQSEEGDLTQVKSRIVSRTNLNSMAREMGIDMLIETDMQATHSRGSIAGNALEALFGAVFLDLGYPRTRKTILMLLSEFADMNTIEDQEADFKSRIYEEAHKRKSEISFNTRAIERSSGVKSFVSEVYMDKLKIGEGTGSSKKKAEQRASEQGLKKLNGSIE
ncbi:ribonuclease III [Cryomorpha ignava]|uniref:Ribonuclease 3 n=1 Tax=Cryomorpha ignava TaxID=101383 RepID=A0A7K3WUD5_9FLAO|nr:ribonuclease III [Cryomorpha ignava]NEN25280.1 ribonuclease III [Cryomorpha ignava]